MAGRRSSEKWNNLSVFSTGGKIHADISGKTADVCVLYGFIDI